MGETADDCGKLSISTQKAVVGQSILRGDEKPEQLQDKFDWNAITNFEVENENGSKLAFSDVFYDTKTIVIFIRHFLCYMTKEYVEDLAKIPRDLLETKRIRLAIIGCGDSKYMKQFRKDTAYWAEFYTDSTGELHKLMGCKLTNNMGSTTESKHAKSSGMMGVIKSAFRATSFPGEWQGSSDQQGGAFILGPGQQCDFAHVDQYAANHHPINKLLDLVDVENVCFEKDSGVITV